MTLQIVATARPADPAFNAELSHWLGLAAAGDPRAFQRLYEASAPRLLRLVRAMVGHHQAEDVLAEVYLQAWYTMRSYDKDRGEPMAWLVAMARSRALDLLRREKVRRCAGEVEATPETGPSPEDDLLAREQEQLLHAALRSVLSPRERHVLALAYFKDCSHSEIATLTGWPLGSVKSLARRAHTKVRAHLQPTAVPATEPTTGSFCTLLPAVEKTPDPTMERRCQAHTSTYPLHS